jgi:hypothetical protein
MFVLAGQSDGTIADEKSTETTMNDVRGKKTQPGTTHGVQIGVGSPSPQICGEKVLHIRQQLAAGKYDFDKRLNVAFDKLLDELFGQESKTRSLTGS